MSSRSPVTLAVVNWNTRQMLAQCLNSIRDSDYLSGMPGPEVIVVDNASRDGSAKMVHDRFPWVRLIANVENVGFARANNQAIQQASGRYVVLLNSDAVLGSSSLLDLVNFADDHPDAGIVGVRLLNPDGSYQAALNDFPTPISVILESWGVAKAWNPYYPSYPPGKSQHATPCHWIGGACLLARRAAIDQVGLLDETFFMNSEEVDWCYRMRKAGWEVWYTPTVEVVHFGGASANRRSVVQRMRLYEGKVRFLRKHYGPLAAEIVCLNLRVTSVLKAILYQIRYLIKRTESDQYQAQSHWQVAWARNWV